MLTVADHIRRGEALLADAGIPDARRDALTLIATALGKDRTFIYAHSDYEPDTGERERITEYLQRRSTREPLQYIRGMQEFYGLEFELTPDVLIPRPETEMLVERAIDLLRDVESPRFVDVGTGSGCILVSILAQVPTANGVAVDISPAAIAVARRNAQKHGVTERSEFIVSDLFDDLRLDRFDMIVSNPPYVPADDLRELQSEVRDFEPRSALTDGGSGLEIVAKIIDRAPEHLRPGGTLLVEFGSGQAEQVRALLGSADWESAVIEPDLQGIPRVLAATARRY